ncbi:MAG: hypothetical protein J6D46_02290 [Lachnospiraceae bacterium]|nr:hypothetical protein [Lachnospiraceae bacterium]
MSTTLNKSLLRKIAIVVGLGLISLVIWFALDLSLAALITQAALDPALSMHLIRPVLFIGAFVLINVIGSIVAEKR